MNYLNKKKINYAASVIKNKTNTKGGKREFRYTNCDVLRSIVCINRFQSNILKQKEVIYMELKSYANRFANINDIIHKFRQIDILMHLLLNNEQIKCINHWIDNNKLTDIIVKSENKNNEIIGFEKLKETINPNQKLLQLLSNNAVQSIYDSLA